MKATVQIPAFSESPWKDRLRQIVSQPTPDDWTVEYEAWVTPNAPDPSDCNTLRQAREVEGVSAFVAPEGKLSARNEAHAHAVENGSDVIVTWDADAPPIDQNALIHILAPFENPHVIAANSNPVAPNTLGGLAVNLAGKFEDNFRPHIHGQMSAFTADGWRTAGPFDDDIDQLDIDAVRKEEEFDFRSRLAEYGRVVDVREAKVLNDTRRHECKANRAFSRFGSYPTPRYCDQAGVKTFHPDYKRNR